MKQTQFHLMRSRRFLPLFVTQFLGAFNDNLFKAPVSFESCYVERRLPQRGE